MVFVLVYIPNDLKFISQILFYFTSTRVIRLDIFYATKNLEKILTNERLIKKEYTTFYKKIINRLSELRAANNLDEIPHVPPPRRHKLDGEYHDCWGVDVSKNYRIVLRPTGNWDEHDLKTVVSVEILTIEDYH